MRVLNGFIALVLIGFAAVQYNDPDAAFWASAYGIAAGWALVAAVAPRVLRRRPVAIGLCLTTAAALVGLAYFWPDVPQWWRIEVWWEAETAREGMGMMVVALALFVTVSTAIRAGRPHRRGGVAA